MNGPLAKKKSRNRHSSGNNSFQSTSVRFQPETDSRGMFPDAQTFQDFKKQRDMFYELGQAHDMFSRIFSTRIYEFFLPNIM